MRTTRPVILVAGLMVAAAVHATAQPPAFTGFRLRSAQLDAVTIPTLWWSAGASVDVDLLGTAPALGLRASIARVVNDGFDGRSVGSPFTEADLLARGTLSGRWLRGDLYVGACYSEPTNQDAGKGFGGMSGRRPVAIDVAAPPGIESRAALVGLRRCVRRCERRLVFSI